MSLLMNARLARHRLWILTAAFTLVVFGFFAVVSLRASADGPEKPSSKHVLTVHDAGTTKGVYTDADTLGDALEQAGIVLEQNDITEPSLDEKLVASNYDVNIYRARPMLIIDGQSRMKVMTAYQTPKQIAKEAGIELYDEDSTTVSQVFAGALEGALETMVIDRATEFNLVLYGKSTILRTHTNTVADMLKEKDITLQKDDHLSVDMDAPLASGMKIEIWRNGVQTVTVDEPIKMPIEKIVDTDRSPDYHAVKEVGANGKRSVTYKITMKNGKEVARKEIASVVVDKPKKQVEVVGGKFNYTGGPLSDAQIQALGNCESGMTATRNSGNGFYGAFQFMPSTWRTVAPAPYNQGMPHEAPLDAQKQAVQNLLSRSSIFTQFPGCANKMRAQGIL